MVEYLLSVWGPAEHDELGNYSSKEEMEQAFEDTARFNESLQERGHWVFAGGLMSASTATVVDGTGDQVVTTDGPFLESKELLRRRASRMDAPAGPSGP